MELFGPTLFRNFLLKKSDFLGIFKNVLTGFYCTSEQKTYVVYAIAHSCSTQIMEFSQLYEHKNNNVQ
jgi:hypothetical protein